MRPFVVLALIASLPTSAADAVTASDEGFAELAAAVTGHLLKEDYPELFDDKPYRVRIEDLQGADLDGDGRTEVVALFRPHFRQSPTLVIFRVDRNLKVTRVKEAFAPGPLVKVDGSQLDSHSLGQAVDFSTEGSLDEPKRLKVILSALKSFGMVVAYPEFFHADGRTGGGAFIDLSSASVPGGAKDCNGFQFSTVDEIAVAPFAAGGAGVIAARIGERIHLIRVASFRTDGLLEKSVTVIETPSGFAAFEPGAVLRYRTADGRVVNLAELARP